MHRHLSAGPHKSRPVAHLGHDGHMAYAVVNESQSGQSEFRPHRMKQLIQASEIFLP